MKDEKEIEGDISKVMFRLIDGEEIEMSVIKNLLDKKLNNEGAVLLRSIVRNKEIDEMSMTMIQLSGKDYLHLISVFNLVYCYDFNDHNEYQRDPCNICHTVDKYRRYKLLLCGHIFHSFCIESLIETQSINATCPKCETHIFKDVVKKWMIKNFV